MRILYAHLYDAAFKIGGAEKVLLDIAGAMVKNYGAEAACVVNPGDLSELLKKEKVRVIPIAWSKFKTPQTISGIRRAIEDFQPDVIHSHHRYTTFLLDVFFKKKIPIIHTEHVLRKTKKIFFRYGHQATGVHETVSRNLIEYFKVPPEKVITIPNAVSVPPPNQDVLKRLADKIRTSDQRVLALCIGRLEEQKGHIHLVNAVRHLTEKYRRRIQILLAGDGALQGMLKKMVSESGLNDCFSFLGHTSDISELLNLSQFLVLPSLWEGMPLSILEAYAAERAVIATDIPGSRELVRQDKTGKLVAVSNPKALAKAIEEFIDSPEKVKEMGREAKRWAESNFSYRVMTERYHRLYREMIESLK